MTRSSKKLEDERGGLTAAAIIDKVFDSHRRSHHFSIKKQKPEVYDNILKECENIKMGVLIQALEVYRKTKQAADNKRPHPNYFLAIVKRLKQTKEKDREKLLWGKTI